MYTYNLGLKYLQVADENGQKEAIIAENGTSISYIDLNNLSNRYAFWLVKQSVKKGDVIAIFNTKRIESFALMIAALKLGVIYVNLDFSSPVDRLKKILNNCNPALVCYDDDTIQDTVNLLNFRSFNLVSDDLLTDLELHDEINLTKRIGDVCSDNPAYIMFTSGSTGFPKGAVITHQNVLNFIDWASITYDITKEDIFTNVNPMFFDNSVFDFYASIFNGAKMATLDADTIKDPGKIVKRVDDVKATIWFSVPSMLVFLMTMKAITNDVFHSLRIISFGGEGFPKPKLKQLFDTYSERIRLLNVYGPTECTCICSAYEISANDFENMKVLAPLGQLAPNFDYLIVDQEGKQSNEGELLLGGPQVGLGYFNDTERTRQSFIQSPFNLSYKKVVYKTGDFVRLEQNGMLHIIGRVDNQIKHMGYRIELEEIEAAFSTLTYVDEVGVVYEKFENGLGQIKAFLKTNRSVELERIRKDIKSILPAYMIPRSINILDTIPKNKNGKIDRIALLNFKS